MEMKYRKEPWSQATDMLQKLKTEKFKGVKMRCAPGYNLGAAIKSAGKAALKHETDYALILNKKKGGFIILNAETHEAGDMLNIQGGYIVTKDGRVFLTKMN